MKGTQKKVSESETQEKKQKEKKGKIPFKISDRRFWVRQKNGEKLEQSRETSPYPSFVEELKAKKEESERRLLEYIQAFKKMKEEQEEFRQRLRKDIDNRVHQRKKELFLKLLDMLDNLDRAILSAKGKESNSRLLEGIILTRDHFLSILKSEGVERIETLGKAFDPEFAEAVMTVETEDPHKINIILEEISPAYSFHEQILRPAKVKVGIKATSSKESPEKGDT